ncbi:MAG: hypothetical protein MI723_08125 [Caulobacterales bacterium]|nr:hypothetical protein [Caulobacterales bacterium]
MSAVNKWNLIIDVERCHNCNNCVLAAKDEYVGNDFPGYSAAAPQEGAELIAITRTARGAAPIVDAAYLVTLCNHCDDAPCKTVGGEAVVKREDGLVLIDPDKAKGRRDIVEACPYGAIIWNEERELPQIWTFDAHLLDAGWSRPRCVQSCPTEVFEAVKITDEEMAARADAEKLEVLRPELNTKPRVYYRNLHRIFQCFIGGAVVADVGGVEECVGGARVELYQAGALVRSAETDVFGEFVIDRLEPASGAYRIAVDHPEFGRANLEAELGESVHVGTIQLQRAPGP